MTTTPTPLLRRVTREQAAALGYVSAQDLADRYGVIKSTVTKALAKENAPAPVARAPHPQYPKRLCQVWDAAAIDAFLLSLDGEHLMGSRRRSQPPRRIGTSTPSRTRAYTWRDPNRVSGLPKPTSSTTWQAHLGDLAS